VRDHGRAGVRGYLYIPVSLPFKLFCILDATLYVILFVFLSHSEGKFLVTKFEFGDSFGMSLEGDYHEVEVTANLELLVTFGMSLEGACHELYK
jgi:hypothetical protein